MKKILTNLALILFMGSALIAQDDFKKGFIVKQNGDTLSGLVNFQKEAVNNAFCNFKRFEIAFPVVYTPEKIIAYGIIGGKQFVSINFKGKRVFAEYLVKGKISLLYFNKGTEYYFTKVQDNIPVEIKQTKTIDPNSLKEFVNYKDYLKSAFLPVEFNKEIDESKLSIESLTLLLKKYNELSNVSYEIPNRPEEKSAIKDYSIVGTNKFQVGVLGGLAMFKFSPSMNKDGFFYLTNADFKRDLNPIGGIFIRWNVSRNKPKLFFQTNVLYQKVSLYGFSKHEKPTNKSVMLYDDIFIDYKELKIQGLMNYRLNSLKIGIIPHLGAGYNSRINPTYSRFSEEFNSKNNVVQSYEFNDIKIFANNWALIGGVSFERKLSSARFLLLNIDYELSNNLIDASGNSSLSNIDLKGKGHELNITLSLTL